MNFSFHRRLTAPAVAIGLVLAGCGSTQTESVDDGKLSVITSTAVWASLAEEIAGDDANVEAIAPRSMDPHHFTLTAQNMQTINSGDIAVVNGLHYDSYMKMEGFKGTLITAGSFEPADNQLREHDDHDDHESHEGHDDHESHESHDDHESHEGHEGHEGHHHEGDPHVWFRLSTAMSVADALEKALTDKDPQNASDYASRAEKLKKTLQGYVSRLTKLKDSQHEVSYVATEGAGGIILADAGFTNDTPEEYQEAANKHGEVSSKALNDMLDTITKSSTTKSKQRSVSFIVHNPMTPTNATKAITDAAVQAALPQVEIIETLPKDVSYVDMIGGIIDVLEPLATTKS